MDSVYCTRLSIISLRNCSNERKMYKRNRELQLKSRLRLDCYWTAVALFIRMNMGGKIINKSSPDVPQECKTFALLIAESS